MVVSRKFFFKAQPQTPDPGATNLIILCLRDLCSTLACTNTCTLIARNLGEEKEIITTYINIYNFYPEHKHPGEWISVLNLCFSEIQYIQFGQDWHKVAQRRSKQTAKLKQDRRTKKPLWCHRHVPFSHDPGYTERSCLTKWCYLLLYESNVNQTKVVPKLK